jgi:hypothetical protein
VYLLSTNSEIISDALSLIGIISETEGLTPLQGRLCLRVMNDLLAEWDNRGINVGHFPQTDTTAQFPANADIHLAIKNNLAVRLAPHFQRQPPPVVIAEAVTTFDRLLRGVMVDRMYPVDMSHMPRTDDLSGVTVDITEF